MLALNLMHHRSLYGILWSLKDRRLAVGAKAISAQEPPTFTSRFRGRPGKEWFSQCSYVERSLIGLNLDRVDFYEERRKALAGWYHERLDGVPGVKCAPDSLHALSYYTIRADQSCRDFLHRYLLDRGIDTGLLFSFPRTLDPKDFPNASTISREVLNLPLTTDITRSDADRICSSIVAWAHKM